MLHMTASHPPPFGRGVSAALSCRSRSWTTQIEISARVDMYICTYVRMHTHARTCSLVCVCICPRIPQTSGRIEHALERSCCANVESKSHAHSSMVVSSQTTCHCNVCFVFVVVAVGWGVFLALGLHSFPYGWSVRRIASTCRYWSF